MSQENENPEKDLSRAEWLRYAGDKSLPQDAPYDDLFSRRALQGLRYVESEEEARQLLQRLESRMEERINAKLPQPRVAPLLLKIAAAVLLLLLPLSIVWFNTQSVSSQTAFEQHFEISPSNIPLSGPLREGRPESDTDLKQQAIIDYENGLFSPANEKFALYLRDYPSDIAVRFYYGVSLLAEGKATAAIDQLEQVRRQSSIAPYRIPAQWYIGLAYLKLDQRAEAIDRLRSLANQTLSTHYREKAEAVLQDID